MYVSIVSAADKQFPVMSESFWRPFVPDRRLVADFKYHFYILQEKNENTQLFERTEKNVTVSGVPILVSIYRPDAKRRTAWSGADPRATAGTVNRPASRDGLGPGSPYGRYQSGAPSLNFCRFRTLAEGPFQVGSSRRLSSVPKCKYATAGRRAHKPGNRKIIHSREKPFSRNHRNRTADMDVYFGSLVTGRTAEVCGIGFEAVAKTFDFWWENRKNLK